MVDKAIHEPKPIRIPGYVSHASREITMEDPIEDLQNQLYEVQDSLTEHEKRIEDTEHFQEDFAAQFLPGRTFLQGLLYRLVYEETVTPVTGTRTFYPGGVTSIPNDDTTVGFDISNELQHAFYDISAHTITSVIAAAPTITVSYGGSSVGGTGVFVELVRVYKTAPARLESFIGVYNVGTAIPIKLKVYRKIGLT